MSALIIRHGNPAALPLDLLLSAIPSLPRHALDRLAQQAIDRLDEIDGDPDLEDDDPDQCLAGDDGCARILHKGRIVWGSDQEDQHD